MKKTYAILCLLVAFASSRSFAQTRTHEPASMAISVGTRNDGRNQYSNNKVLTSDDMLLNELYEPVGKGVTPNLMTLFVYSYDGKLAAYDLKASTQQWAFTAQDSVESTGRNGFALHEGVIYIPFINGEIYAINSITGKPFWFDKISFDRKKQRIKGQYPYVYEGMLFIPSVNSNLYALDARTGKLSWNYRLDYPYNHIPTVAVNSRLFVPNAPYIYSFDAKTGEALYQRAFQRAMYASPVTDGEYAIVADESNMIYALNPHDMSIVWEYKLEDNRYGIKGKMKCEDGKLYIAPFCHGFSPSPSVYCIDSKNGKQLWRTNLDKPEVTYIELLGGRIYGYTKDGVLFGLDKATGETLFEIQPTNLPASNLELYGATHLLYYSRQGVVKLSLEDFSETILFPHQGSPDAYFYESHIKLVE